MSNRLPFQKGVGSRRRAPHRVKNAPPDRHNQMSRRTSIRTWAFRGFRKALSASRTPNPDPSMPRPDHYSPAIDRFLVSCLYHEARRRRMPMTRLVDELLRGALAGSSGWQQAESQRSARQPSRSEA